MSTKKDHRQEEFFNITKNLNTFVVNLNFYQIKIKEMNEKDKMHLKTILQCTIVVKTQIVPMT